MPAGTAAAPGVRREAGAGERGPCVGDCRPRAPRRRAGDQSAPARLCRSPAEAGGTVGWRGAGSRPDPLLGIPGLRALGPAAAESATAGRARRIAADGGVMTPPPPMCYTTAATLGDYA